MKRIVLGIALVSLILSSFPSSFAYTVDYEKWGNIVKGVPTVCILEPDYRNNPVLSESFSDRLMDESRISINEWMVQLQTSERGRDKSMWEIKQIHIPIEEQETFDYNECTVFIRFTDKPESKDDWYKLLGKTSYEIGNTGRSDITIYYTAIELCKTEDKKWVYFDPCYKDYPRLMQQLQSVIKHEFGHALGLGHYVASDQDVNVAWARGTVVAPSIMAVFTHQNINKNYITHQDVSAVVSMYGDNGFFPSESIGQVFEEYEPSSFTFVLPRGGFIVATVDGLLKEKYYLSGIPVKITIVHPDGSNTFHSVFPSSDGVFSYEMVINENFGLGEYKTFAEFRGVKSPETSFLISSEGIMEESKIPLWVKNSVTWWAEDKINDQDLVLGIQYLILQGVLNPPGSDEQRKSTQAGVVGVQIPKFVKQVAGWWGEDKITDEEFIDSMQYLIKKRILVI